MPYQRNEAVLHSDARMLPRRRRAWASWNYHLLDQPGDRATVTYHMNRLQSLQADRELCVTLNRTEAIDPAKVIRTIPYAHPVYTDAGLRAQARRREISGHNRTHYCGAYWGWGFHEDGVVSALTGRRALRGAIVSTAGIDCEHERPAAGMASAIYEGTVRHRRFAVRAHELLPAARTRLRRPRRAAGAARGASAGTRDPASVRFRRGDYLGDARTPLSEAVRDAAEAQTGVRPRGPIRLLANLSALRALLQSGELLLLHGSHGRPAGRRRRGGHEHAVGRTPLLCPGRRRRRRGALAAVRRPEVRSPAVRSPAARSSGHDVVLGGDFDKALHVSPFMGMNHRYEWRMTAPAQTLSVHISSRQEGRVAFDATLSLRRRELTRASLAKLTVTTLRTLVAIYAQAALLKLKGVPAHPHVGVDRT